MHYPTFYEKDNAQNAVEQCGPADACPIRHAQSSILITYGGIVYILSNWDSETERGDTYSAGVAPTCNELQHVTSYI